jgi:dTDP-4-dehydrorhamnose 3,5-epimerase
LSDAATLVFTSTPLAGVMIVDPIRREDERGFFARTWCSSEFREHGLVAALSQCSVSFNVSKGTLRGLHYQAHPHGETKLVRCTMGAIFDVVVDVRPESPTYTQWTAVELTATNRRMLYIPEGFAHGFQTLQDDTEVFYQMANDYVASAARGVRWNDPVFGITWPPDKRVISPRDQTYSDFSR